MHEYGFAAKMLDDLVLIARRRKIKKILAASIEYADDHADAAVLTEILHDLVRASVFAGSTPELSKSTKFFLKRIPGNVSLFKIKEIKYE